MNLPLSKPVIGIYSMKRGGGLGVATKRQYFATPPPRTSPSASVTPGVNPTQFATKKPGSAKPPHPFDQPIRWGRVGERRASCSWGGLAEGDQILSIGGQQVTASTRIDCVKALKGQPFVD